jgi:hypothetical protein
MIMGKTNGTKDYQAKLRAYKKDAISAAKDLGYKSLVPGVLEEIEKSMTITQVNCVLSKCRSLL